MFKNMLREVLKEQEEVLNTAMEENRAMSEEEQTKFKDLQSKVKNIENSIAFEKEVEEKQKIMNTPVKTPIHAEPKNNNVKKWKNLGDLLTSVKNACTPGGTIDNRLLVKNLGTGLNEQINSEGGFLVDQDFVSELMARTYETSMVANRTNKIPIGANSNGLRMNAIDETSRINGSRYGGVQSYWSSEGGTVAATKPTFREMSIKLEKLMAFCYATDELLSDSVALESIIRKAYAEEMAFRLDDAIINGDGSGKPLGVLNSDALVTVAKESGQSAGSVVFENIVKMYSRMWAKSRPNAVWFINQDIEPQLFSMSLSVGTGGSPAYLPANGLAGQPFATLMGRPVIPIEQCQTLGTVGDIILADMSQYITIDKGGVDSAVSMHVRFLYDEQVFRFVYRTNGLPSWNSALTPFKGSKTQSPFVALATRA